MQDLGISLTCSPRPESAGAASARACKGDCVTMRLESWWMSDWWEPCKTNLLYPCWCDCTLLQRESEEDGVLQKGKHSTEVVVPSGSRCPGTTFQWRFSAPRGTEHLSVPAFGKGVLSTLCLVSQGLSVLWNKSWPFSPCFQIGYNHFCLPLLRNRPAVEITLLSLQRDAVSTQFPADLEQTVSTWNRPRGMLLEWCKSWCLKIHSGIAWRRDLARDRYLVVLALTKQQCRPGPVWGALNKTTSVDWHVAYLLPCNELPSQKRHEDQKKKIFLSVIITHGVLSSCISSNVMTFLTAWLWWSQNSLFTALWSNWTFLGHALSLKAKEWKAHSTQEPDMPEMHRVSQSKYFRSVRISLLAR